MDHIWSPWRFKYVVEGVSQPGCVFCRVLSGANDRQQNIIFRDSHCFVILNLYPYTSGHLMIVPYQHEANLSALDSAITSQIMELTKKAIDILRSEYKPDGFNVGLNLGCSAGAGVAEHIHLHIVPRWNGDANFLTVVGETRVMPEDLSSTYERLAPRFAALKING